MYLCSKAIILIAVLNSATPSFLLIYIQTCHLFFYIFLIFLYCVCVNVSNSSDPKETYWPSLCTQGKGFEPVLATLVSFFF